MTAPPTLHAYTDGAAGPTNPGPAASAWIVLDPASGEVLAEDAVYIGRRTNNVAEYTAILRALEACAALGAGSVVVHSDSQLCVNQLNGAWRVTKPHLGRLREQVMEVAEGLGGVRFKWVSRGDPWVSECDAMANEVLVTRRTSPSRPPGP